MVIEQDMMRSLKTSGGLPRGRGMNDRSRIQWISSTHESAKIHDDVTSLTNTHISSSEQNVDLTPSRISRDTSYNNKMYDWLLQHNPFMQGDDRLKSPSTGVIGQNLTCNK